MKIGDIFRYRHNGKHDDVILIILHDYNAGERILYNIDYGVRVGLIHLLYSKHIGRATEEQILFYEKKANCLKK
jgi:hypothetical protein